MTTLYPHGRSRPTYNTLSVSVGREQAQERTQGPKLASLRITAMVGRPKTKLRRYASPGRGQSHRVRVHGQTLSGPLTPALRWIMPMRHFWIASSGGVSARNPSETPKRFLFLFLPLRIYTTLLLYRNGVMGLSGCSLCGV